MNFDQTPLERSKEEAWIAQYRDALNKATPEPPRDTKVRELLGKTQGHVAAWVGKLTSVVSTIKVQKPLEATKAILGSRFSSQSERTTTPGREKAS